MEERQEEVEPQDEVGLPEDAVEDLEPEGDDSEDVKGGAFKQGFPIKWQGAS
jgi:hypothetical protein